MPVFNGNALDALRQWLTQGDTVDPATTGPNLGSVAISSPGTSATSLGKAEDAPHTSGDVGIMALGVVNTAFTARAADSDYIPLATDLRGNLILSGATSNTITLAKAEDVAHTSGDSGIGALGVRADTDATQTSATADYGFIIVDSAGRQKVVSPLNWSATHTPVANTQATATQASAAGFRHVCTSVAFSLTADTGIIAATTVLVNLRDGATGAGTILWSQRISVPATAGSCKSVVLNGLSIVGTAATAMTLEFAAAGGASTFESVALTGYDVV
ncbi:MAG: hypothetical protein WAT66_04400 [Actinomycetota bacterium]